MNEELKKIAAAAGAPDEVMEQMWFNIFCMKFAAAILDIAEEATVGVIEENV